MTAVSALVGHGDADAGAEVVDEHAGEPLHLPRERRREDRRRDGGPHEPVRALLHRALEAHRARARLLQDPDDARGGGVRARARDARDDLAVDHHGGGEEPVAGAPGARHRLARERLLVDRGEPPVHLGVGGDALARRHDDVVAHGEVARRHPDHPIALDPEGVGRVELHEAGERLARALLRPVEQQVAEADQPRHERGGGDLARHERGGDGRGVERVDGGPALARGLHEAAERGDRRQGHGGEDEGRGQRLGHGRGEDGRVERDAEVGARGLGQLRRGRPSVARRSASEGRGIARARAAIAARARAGGAGGSGEGAGAGTSRKAVGSASLRGLGEALGVGDGGVEEHQHGAR